MQMPDVKVPPRRGDEPKASGRAERERRRIEEEGIRDKVEESGAETRDERVIRSIFRCK